MDGPWMPIRRRVTVQIPCILHAIFFGSPFQYSFDCIFAACLSHLLRECGFSSRSCNCRQLLWLHHCPRPSYVPFLVASVAYNTKLKPDNSSSSRYRARSCGNRLMAITGETMATIVSTFSRFSQAQQSVAPARRFLAGRPAPRPSDSDDNATCHLPKSDVR